MTLLTPTVCDFSCTQQAVLQFSGRQQGVLQFNSILALSTHTAQTLQVKGSAQDCPSLETPAPSLGLLCPPTGCNAAGPHSPFQMLHRLLEQLTELGKALYLLSSVSNKGRGSGTAKWQVPGTGKGEGVGSFHTLHVCCPPRTRSSPNPIV